jgi:hypothetical protein
MDNKQLQMDFALALHQTIREGYTKKKGNRAIFRLVEKLLNMKKEDWSYLQMILLHAFEYWFILFLFYLKYMLWDYYIRYIYSF